LSEKKRGGGKKGKVRGVRGRPETGDQVNHQQLSRHRQGGNRWDWKGECEEKKGGGGNLKVIGVNTWYSWAERTNPSLRLKTILGVSTKCAQRRRTYSDGPKKETQTGDGGRRGSLVEAG